MSLSLRLKAIQADGTYALRQAVLRPDHPLLDSHFAGDDLPAAGHFGVFEGERLIAVGTVVPEPCKDPNGDEAMARPGAWRLRGMATADGARGKGCGGMILQACLEHAWQHGASVVWCNARTGALRFYLRHGFAVMSDEYIMPGIGPHYLMSKRSNQRSAQR